MSLSPTDIANIERVIKNSSLTEVYIEQNGERIVIGGAKPAVTIQVGDLVAVAAPAVGTVSLGSISIGQHVAEGDRLAGLHVLNTERPITAPASGRIAAILIEDGGLASYGADLILIEPETAT